MSGFALMPEGLSTLALAQWAAMSATLVQWLATAGMAVVFIAIVLCLVRIIIGPTLADRATGLDAIGVQLIGIVILLTMLSGSMLFVDGMLILALLSFAGTVAMSQFIARPYVLRYKAQSPPDRKDPHEATPPTPPPPHPPDSPGVAEASRGRPRGDAPLTTGEDA